MKRTIEAEIADALEGDTPLMRALRGEDADLGNPALNALVERTSRRLAAIPDTVAPQIAEARSEDTARIILEEAIIAAFAEIDGVLGRRAKST